MRLTASTFVAFLLTFVVSFHETIPASADAVNDAVQLELAALAKQIDPLLKKQKADTIHVGAFQGPGTTATGPEIQTKLADALRALGYTIDAFDYDIELRGRYQQFDGPRDVLGVEIIVQLFDDGGRPIVEISGKANQPIEVERQLFGTGAVPRILAIPSSLPPGLGEPDRSKRLREQQETPPTELQGTRIYAAQDSPYAIEILVKRGTAYRPLTVETKGRKRFPFVDVGINDVYAVRLINESPHEAAVNLTVDGINVFRFSESNPKPTFWIVPPESKHQPGVTNVLGWDKNAHKTIEFQRTEYPQSAAARLKIEPNPMIGQITAQFSASWQHDDQKPADEPTTRGTGFGDEIVDRKETVKRFVGNVRATIVVRYER